MTITTDLDSLPPDFMGELIAGELHVTPHPGAQYLRAAFRLAALITPPFDDGIEGPGGWILLEEPELHLGRDLLVPDLAGWRSSQLEDAQQISGISVAPDWVCEVLTPATTVLDRSKKLPIYAREGVKHAWFVDPDNRSLEVYELRDGELRLVETLIGANVRAKPFDAIELRLSEVWASAE